MNIIHIPTRKVVALFIQRTLSKDANGLIVLNDHPLALEIKKHLTWLEPLHEMDFPNDFRTQLSFVVEGSSYELYMDEYSAKYINQAVYAYIKNEIRKFLISHCQEKGDIQAFIDNFLAAYSITEDELKLESLKKDFYRYRLKHPQLCQVDFRYKLKNLQNHE
jgi:hypothetical protein